MKTKQTVKLKIVTGLTLLSLMLAGCDSGEKSVEAPEMDDGRPKLIIAGSSFASPFFSKLLETWGADHLNMQYSYRSIGSGAGIEEFISGTADIGTTDAPLKPAERARLEEEIAEIIVASGMISVAYNLDGIDGSLKLPREVYPDIFMGKITQWDDPKIVAANPGLTLPAKPIQVVARSDSSGTTYTFTHHLSAISANWKDELGAAKLIDWPGSTVVARGNEGVAQKLAITKNSIGYVEFGFAQRLGLKVAQLQNKSGEFVLPNLESGKLGAVQSAKSSAQALMASVSDPSGEDSYPVVAYTWALLRSEYESSEKDSAVQDLIKWTITDGQQMAKSLMYLPLSPDIVQQGLKKLGG